MSELVPKERVDLIAFQSKLKLIWKEQATAYFDLIKKYFQAKLSKKELDVLIKNLLVSDDNIALHNLFIKAVIHNATCNLTTNSPSSYLLTSFSLDKRFSAGQSHSKKKEKKRKGRGSEVGVKLDPVEPPPKAPTKCNFSIANDPFDNYHSKRFLETRRRMYRVAAEKALYHIDNDAVECLLVGLEMFLQRVIQTTIQVTEKTSTPNQSTVITADDLLQTAQSRPKLFGEEWVMTVETLLAKPQPLSSE